MTEDVSFDTATDESPDSSDEDTGFLVDRQDFTRTREIESSGADRTYQSEDGEQGSDDVDPRKLYREPSIDEIRWYFREGPFGSTIVEKPVRDAFKNGYEVHNDRPGKVEPFLDRYVPKMIDAEIKGRRDGFAILFFQLRDGASVGQPPEDVTSITRIRILTLDDLTDSISSIKVSEKFDDLERKQINVLDDGLVVVDDVGHPRHEDLLGYVHEGSADQNNRFIHADRCQHFAWRTNVDGDVDQDAIGRLQGDSVLTPVLHSLKAIQKGVWGMGQTLFRYSAPLHAVETPDDYGEEDFELVDQQMNALNSASSVTLPPGTTMDTHDAASDFDPEPFYEALVENVCTGSEFTKSVLKGTQTGTVSGSETDVKNYFSGVERTRNNRYREKIREAVTMASTWNRSIVPTFSLGYELEFEPIFRIDALDRTEAMTRAVTAVTNGLQNYILSPEDAQSVLQEEWADLDVDVDLDELTEAEKDDIDRIVVQKGKQYPQGRGPEEEIEGNPSVGQNLPGNESPNEGPQDPADPT